MTLSTALRMRLYPRIYHYMPTFSVKYMTAMDIVFKGTGTYNNKFLIRQQYLCSYVINWKIWAGC